MQDASLINGLLAQCQELLAAIAELRERMAIIAYYKEAVERVLNSLGYAGQLVDGTPRTARTSSPTATSCATTS